MTTPTVPLATGSPRATVAGLVHRHALDARDEALLLGMLGLAEQPRAVCRVRVRPVIPAAQHGRRSTYVQGCGCAGCRAANARYMAGWRSRGGAVTGGCSLRVVVLEVAQGRGRHRGWPGQVALVVPRVRSRRVFGRPKAKHGGGAA